MPRLADLTDEIARNEAVLAQTIRDLAHFEARPFFADDHDRPRDRARARQRRHYRDRLFGLNRQLTDLRREQSRLLTGAIVRIGVEEASRPDRPVVPRPPLGALRRMEEEES